ncbi:GTPase domain-containing protein [Thermogutta sp.]|uniref:GTPase domain-containing protein n=1 Tax=Thermogutta sp. TaxID=1962930 RepID=UPI00322010C6
MTVQQSSSSHKDQPIWADQIIAEAEAIQRAAGKIQGAPGVSDLCESLDLAIREYRHGRVRGVALVTLIGGTGVGKSTLFNSLIGKPNASPVSQHRRCFTTRPYVAVHPEDRAFLDFPEEWRPVYVDLPVRGWAICDAPDINGVFETNRQLARQLIEKSHYLIYVTMSERRADFDILREIRNYTIAKRWLFVLNRADQISNLSAVREDFCQRLKQLGFVPDDEVVFATIAQDPGHSEVVRLRYFLQGHDPLEVARLAPLDSLLARLQEALGEERLRPLQAAVERLESFRENLVPDIQQIYRKGLQDPVVKTAIQRVMRESIWQYVVDNSWGFAALVGWVRWRWSRLRLAYTLLRLGTSAFSLFQWLRTLVTASTVIFTNLLPLWQISQHLASHCRRELDLIRTHVHELLEELGLEEWGDRTSQDVLQQRDELPRDSAPLPHWLGFLNGLGGVEDPFGAIAALRGELERVAMKAARNAAGPAWVQVMVNLLPLAVSIDFVGRMAYFWWQSAPYLSPEPVFPSGHFYLLTGVMLAITLLPGSVLLARRVKHFGDARNEDHIIHQMGNFPVLQPLVAARDACLELLARCRSLRNKARNFRASLKLGFATARAERNGIPPAFEDAFSRPEVPTFAGPANRDPQPAQIREH